jgi:lipopolysaccharide export system protein LptA
MNAAGHKREAQFASLSVFIRVHQWFRPCLLIILALVSAPSAHALKSDADQPINIRARSVAANEKTGVSTYRGNVVLIQGSLRIEADRLEVTLHDGRTDLIRAWGKPLHMYTRTDAGEEIRATAARAEYHGKARRLDLYDEVELKRDADVFTGAVVHYLLDEQTFSAEGGADGQVTATIQPAKKETGQ